MITIIVFIIHGDQKTFEETQEKKCEKMFRSSHPLCIAMACFTIWK